MKKAILALLLFISFYAKSQGTDSLNGFLGIPFGSNKQQIKSTIQAKFPSAKIYEETEKKIVYDNIQFAGKNCLAMYFALNSEGRLHTAVVLLDNQDHEAFSLYDAIVLDLDKKYHYHDSQYENWSYPYDKSDRDQHGITALKVHKLKIMSFWNFAAADPNTTDDDNIIQVTITDGCNVKLSYQNGAMINEVVEKNNANNSKDY